MTGTMREGAAQVVLLPEGEIGEAVLALVERWTMEGLLDPVYWVPASFVRKPSLIPAQVSAIVMGCTADGAFERREVGLLANLSGDHTAEVVVSSVRWLTADEADRDGVSLAADRLLDAIRKSVPTGFSHEGEALSGTDVRSINIVLGATAVPSVEVASLLSINWQENVVVSPESRQRPGATDTFNDSADIEAWAAFIATSVATLAGLWTGMTSTPIRRNTGSGMSSSVPHVRVVRTFARAVVSSGYTYRLANAVAERLADSSALLADPLVTSRLTDLYVFDEQEVDAEIMRALDYLKQVDSRILSYQPLPSPEQLAPRTVGFRHLGEFLKFSLDKILAIPSWIYTWMVDRASRKAQAVVAGDAEKSGVEVNFRNDAGLRNSDRDLLEISDQLKAMRVQLQARLDAPQPPVRRVNVPSLWKEVRSVIFTLADGISASAAFEGKSIGGRRGMVSDIGLLVPLPSERWDLPDDATRYLAGDEQVDISATWAGTSAARALRTHLDDIARVADAREGDLRTKQASALDECFAAERNHVDTLHRMQDAAADVRVTEGALEIVDQERVTA